MTAETVQLILGVAWPTVFLVAFFLACSFADRALQRVLEFKSKAEDALPAVVTEPIAEPSQESPDVKTQHQAYSHLSRMHSSTATTFLAMLLAYPLVARFAVVPLIVFFPCARPTGLARTFHEQSRWPAALVAAGLAGVAMWVLGKTLFITAGIGVGVGLVVGILIASRLRGLTGDAYGASIELSELAFLLAAAFPRIRGG